MELNEETTQRLQNLLEVLENHMPEASDTVPVILEALAETKQVLGQLVQATAETHPSYSRLEFLSKMLDLSKEEVENGGVEDGLWFGRSVLTFLLNGTSAGTVPVASDKYN
ncbi:hypothetical protein ACD591_19965 [Rufibacter glacialis]|uniref:Uncharacterized protein n=1 Tax=Rufibacter glacialis TaxID=1259555 RepID=A0A5M8Q684_9BACT|nr:hypothetical protein [Rufibacter glacialis]KAA6430618.1 hypothetical protein FOE74_19275 [Rufibacter glacialis]GGK85198.1 hypothetical protein GCM10011405_36290 [Rufibacter glacialis]